MAIFKKFTYEQFANFEECSSASHHFCKTNRSFKFPFNVDCLSVQKGKVLFWEHHEVILPFHKCRNVTFQVNDIGIRKKHLMTKKQIDFLFNHVTESGGIVVHESPQFSNQLQHLLEKLRIQRLHIYLETDQREFPYTTKWMKRVDIDDAGSLFLENVFSLNVETVMVRKLRKTTIVNCVKDLSSGKVDFDLKYIKFSDPHFQIEELKRELETLPDFIFPVEPDFIIPRVFSFLLMTVDRKPCATIDLKSRSVRIATLKPTQG